VGAFESLKFADYRQRGGLGGSGGKAGSRGAKGPDGARGEKPGVCGANGKPSQLPDTRPPAVAPKGRDGSRGMLNFQPVAPGFVSDLFK
jgi:hypothetical protein